MKISHLSTSVLMHICSYPPFYLSFCLSYTYVSVVMHTEIQSLSILPLILPTDPNSSVRFSFLSLLSAPLNQGALTIASEWHFFFLTLILLSWKLAYPSGTIHRPSQVMNLSLLCVCVCVCVEPDRQSFALHHTVILAIAEDKEKRKERGEIWKSAQTGAIASLAN